jgi:cob(I)alamin adenosyltransferase
MLRQFIAHLNRFRYIQHRVQLLLLGGICIVGYCHVYTGNGKGKTTAALGLALRAAGAGIRVYIAQFIKGMDYCELHALERFGDLITVEQFGRGCFIVGEPQEEDVALAKQGIERVGSILDESEYGMVILDEVNVAVHLGLLDATEIIDLIEKRSSKTEIILTGRYAHPSIIEKADLVTEMVEVKHYYTKGVKARKGIEK